MTTTTPDPLLPRRDLDFLLFELLGLERLCERPRYADHSRETFGAALDAAHAIAAERFLPHAREGDEQEPHVVDGRVVLPASTRDALRAYADAGFIAAAHDAGDGGMQLPFPIAAACWTVFKSANVATETYGALTTGVANLLQRFGSGEQRARWLPALLAGRWLGTMVLTEPQAGSALAEIRSTASPAGDGRYRIRGQKIFITAGDHELTENIVHMVLARLPDAPPGTRGLSLFIVPKRRVDAAGRVAGPNDVALAGLIHKMGCRGTTSALLAFGDNGDCFGELLGAPHHGLACMFQMMNEARVNVGLVSAALGVAGYRRALAYARERRQGRDAAGRPAAIIEHADVRRMLVDQKVAVEGALALGLYGAALADDAETAPGETRRAEAAALLGLLTPAIKAWSSQHCTEANALAIQVHGGYGYARDYAVEQLYRDNRLNAIHEGTNGIQAIDLLGRKVLADGGQALLLLGQAMGGTIAEVRAVPGGEWHARADELTNAWTALQGTTQALAQVAGRDPQCATAVATPYLEVFGTTVVAWLWLRQAQVAAAALAAGAQGDNAAFYRGKLAAARHCFRNWLPALQPLHTLLRRAGEDAAALPAPDDF